MSADPLRRARRHEAPDFPIRPQRRHLVAVPPPPTERAGPANGIPDPSRRFVSMLAAHAFEVVEGTRSIGQLGAAVSVGAGRQLDAQRTALRERRQVYRDRRRCIPSPGSVRLFRVRPDLAEASVVLHTEHRVHAVALRLEWVHRRWRACELYVL